MSYGDFTTQITGRGAKEIVRDREAKTTSFVYNDRTWTCTDKARAAVASGLADGYEMDYCLAEHCTARGG